MKTIIVISTMLITLLLGKKRRVDSARKLEFWHLDVSAKDSDEPRPSACVGQPDALSSEIHGPQAKKVADCWERVLRRPPMSDDFISVTSSEGRRVYLRLRREGEGTIISDRHCTLRGSDRGLRLLGVPFQQLKEQLADKQRRKILEELEQHETAISRIIEQDIRDSEPTDDVGEDPCRDEEEVEDGPRGADAAAAGSFLWVDKFSPRHYMELLSDDHINRCLLKWLKLWDVVVFNRERRAPRTHSAMRGQETAGGDPRGSRGRGQWEAHRGAAMNRRGWVERGGGGWEGSKERGKGGWRGRGRGGGDGTWYKSKAQMMDEILEEELDDHKRPKYKVALLSGPPGLGKTTLVHVVARHAGYNVVEINASDDRSPEVLRTRVEAATQMRSVLGAAERPNCLLIDEIDGAPLATINALLEIVNRKDGKEKPAAGTTRKKERKKKEGGLLVRPIICICNDVYVPALRQLRQQAFTIAVPMTMASRLAQRLTEITKCQGLRADMGTLLALCNKTDNDIRSCINTLQFLHSRGEVQLSLGLVQSLQVGTKDKHKGLFTIWQEIFQLPQTKKSWMDKAQAQLGESDHDRASKSLENSRFHRILQLTCHSGEYDKISEGLFANYPNVRTNDPQMECVVAALDWLSLQDEMASMVARRQAYTMLRYMPMASIALHMLLAATRAPRLNYPAAHSELLARTARTLALTDAVMGEARSTVRCYTNGRQLLLDSMSLMLDILSPRLRPVNTQLYSTQEKRQLQQLVHTMVSYNLSYQQERTPDGNYLYVLEPNLDDAARFPGVPHPPSMPYAARQLVSREVQLEKMRRTEAALHARNPQEQSKPNLEETKDGETLDKEKKKKGAALKSHERKLEDTIQAVTVVDKPEKDFFGRIVQKKEKEKFTMAGIRYPVLEADAMQRRVGRAIGHSDVWFRFNEGVTNAVRRTIYIRDIL
uniref:CTF18, chromosome transmission fidelity factor 18 homolog (S. cerevisiae) n=1 Tax=Eptatretus burgeri TaxID=7764 RepID=A0A8C4QKU7_EPTBU